MRIGVVLPIAEEEDRGAPPSYPEIRAIAVAAEVAGFDSVWVFDHLLFRFDGRTEGIHECWTVLAGIAEATSRVELGTLVMCTEFRNPALLAKMAATLDHMSSGRLILGLGSGWHDPEFEAFGYPKDHKVSRFADSLAIITELIRTGRSTHKGRYHSVGEAALVPPARPDLPILIAAKRPRMLELTARHADAWNLAWFGLPNERLAKARANLEAACVAVGRDPSSLAITVGVNVRYPELMPPRPADAEPAVPGAALEGSPAEIAAGLAAYRAFGADHLIAALDPTTPEAVAAFADAVARFRAGSGARAASGHI